MSNPADKASLSFTPAPIPAFEAARLQDLYALKILATAAEERFGRYTRLVAENQLAGPTCWPSRRWRACGAMV